MWSNGFTPETWPSRASVQVAWPLFKLQAGTSRLGWTLTGLFLFFFVLLLSFFSSVLFFGFLFSSLVFCSLLWFSVLFCCLLGWADLLFPLFAVRWTYHLVHSICSHCTYYTFAWLFVSMVCSPLQFHFCYSSPSGPQDRPNVTNTTKKKHLPNIETHDTF